MSPRWDQLSEEEQRRLLAMAPAEEPRDWSREVPNPAFFGLTPDRAASLRRSPKGTQYLPLIGLGMILLTYLIIVRPAVDWGFWGWAVASAVGLLFGLWLSDGPIGKTWVQLSERRKCAEPDYLAFMRYEEACRQHEEASRRRAEAEEKRKLAAERALRTKVEWWCSLDGRAFEQELVKVLQARGHEAWRTGGPGDAGVDLELRQGERRIVVQCKAVSGVVGPGAVRDLYGALLHHNADEAWLVTTRGFSGGATEFAQGKPIRLLTIADLIGTGTGT